MKFSMLFLLPLAFASAGDGIRIGTADVEGRWRVDTTLIEKDMVVNAKHLPKASKKELKILQAVYKGAMAEFSKKAKGVWILKWTTAVPNGTSVTISLLEKTRRTDSTVMFDITDMKQVIVGPNGSMNEIAHNVAERKKKLNLKTLPFAVKKTEKGKLVIRGYFTGKLTQLHLVRP